MKRKFGLMAAAVAGMIGMFSAVPTAKADQGWQDIGVTNVVRSNTTVTVNLGSGVKIPNQDNVGVLVRAQGDAAGTGNITITWARTWNGTNVETTPRFTTIYALNGTTQVLGYTNFSTALIGGAEGLIPVSIQNADAACNATNFAILITKKTIRPSP